MSEEVDGFNLSVDVVCDLCSMEIKSGTEYIANYRGYQITHRYHCECYDCDIMKVGYRRLEQHILESLKEFNFSN